MPKLTVAIVAADGLHIHADPGQFGQGVDVDQHCGTGQAEVHRRYQALTPGQETRLIAIFGFEGKRLIEGRGGDVFEWSRLHGARPATEHSRPLRERNMGDYLSRSRASQKQAPGIRGQTASKHGETLLNFLSGCANIVRAYGSRICHYSDMASPKHSISVASDPQAGLSPSE